MFGKLVTNLGRTILFRRNLPNASQVGITSLSTLCCSALIKTDEREKFNFGQSLQSLSVHARFVPIDILNLNSSVT